ncbi:FAD-binding and (Fe-S)-binding domain-containing protein [Kineococcus terrestris]|uniref:FAD-binding and (Fe-S)-binding domain-containing protein n=1 Tax=Kineococcus terrestris TaxID=2044856 RepID=UPI003F689B70
MTILDPARVTGSAPDGSPDGPGELVRTELVRRLGERLGAQQVDASTRRRAEYTSDASNYRVVPQVVVFPRSAEDVVAAHAVCRELGVPFTSRGAGTSVAGNAVGTGVVLDFSRHLHRVLEVDPAAMTALVEPGVVLDDLQRAAAPHGLRFGPDPSTHARCTLGGMIGNDACGSHALAYGRTSHNVVALEVLDGRGRRWWTDDPPADLLEELRGVASAHLATIRTRFATFGRQVSGYALEHLLPETGGPTGTAMARLLTGSEGTLATILTARVRLVRQSPATTFVVLGYASMHEAADATPALLEHAPLAVEGIDRRLADVVVRRGGSVEGLPTGDGWLFVEMGGDTPEESLAAARAMVADSRALDSVVIPTAAEARALWRIREDGAGLAGRSPEGQPAWPGWEDAAVPPANLGAYLREFDALMASHGVDGLAYGHFGDGCIHVRIDFPLYEQDGAPGGAARTKAFLEDAARLVASHGGSLSGEHGDGRARGGLLPLMYDAESVAAFEEVKRAFDPDDLLNPGVIVRPAPVDADLRVPAARPAHALGTPKRRPGGSDGLAFAYSHDGGDLTRAVHRCVGVGKCRADSGGVMCPSYLATGDEKDSTRGRARLLQEMVNGTLVTDGWRSREVLDVLDLCLSCKGCTHDCPAGVDMPTYKAEFLDKHYAGRLRPTNHYLLGWLPRWTRAAAFAPRVVNALTGVPALARLAKRVGGVAQERPLPAFAERTFRTWFKRRALAGGGLRGGEPVVLWVDSFTDAFSPEVGRAAVEVLEHLGFTVSVTREKVCCGLTWVSTGQLEGAKRQLRASLDALDAPHLPEGALVVGLEPSCTALLRDDAAELLPDDPRAHALRGRVKTLAELVAELRPDWQPPAVDQRAVVQPHCHQHAVMGFSPDAALLAKAGVQAQVLSGCCGLAGNFGAEEGHYDVSVQVAEQKLLPALRERGDATVLADGYSCRTQAENLAGVRPKHLAELLAEGLRAQRD